MSQQLPHELIGIPVLARIWNEDEVWNVSAFDIPVVAYGDSLEEARHNFEEAITCHFQALEHFNELDGVLRGLRQKADDRDFYRSRLRSKTLIEDFNPNIIEANSDVCYA